MWSCTSVQEGVRLTDQYKRQMKSTVKQTKVEQNPLHRHLTKMNILLYNYTTEQNIFVFILGLFIFQQSEYPMC